MFLTEDERRRYNRIGDDDDDDELPTTGGIGFARPAPKVTAKRSMLIDEDGPSPTIAKRQYQQQQQQQQQQQILLQVRPEYTAASMQRIWERYEPLVPLKQTVVENVVLIPSYLHKSITDIVNESDKYVRLHQPTLVDLRTCLDAYRDESMTIDPLVELSQTLDLGEAVMYIRETVPLSVYLMARALKVEFCVVITDKVRTANCTFDDVTVRPVTASSTDGRTQTFDIEQLVAARLDRMDPEMADLFVLQVRMYMYSLGIMTSEAATLDTEFLDEALEAVTGIKDGTVRLLKQKEEKDKRVTAAADNDVNE